MEKNLKKFAGNKKVSIFAARLNENGKFIDNIERDNRGKEKKSVCKQHEGVKFGMLNGLQFHRRIGRIQVKPNSREAVGGEWIHTRERREERTGDA